MTRTAVNPTEGELAILSVLWERGPSTVRDVHQILERRNPTGYTTVLKLMQIMTEKGLVERDESRKAHVYHPRISEERTQKSLVTDLLDKAFRGNPAKLVMQALSSNRASDEELAEIRKILDSMEGR
jgi:BlaI family transcriptional regulator, penicillinase repressor